MFTCLQTKQFYRQGDTAWTQRLQAWFKLKICWCY